MDANNVAVLRGTISTDPVVRVLPSGDSVTQIELTTRMGSGATSVPVAVHDRPVTAVAGDEVLVVGHVSRRFFRAGGTTQARTEVIADRVVKATRVKTAQRALTRACELLERSGDDEP